MELLPKQPSTKGPAQWFTGDVWFDVIAKGEEPSRMRVNTVRFSPGARTAWHAHAVGQTLHVTEGLGRVQARGGEVIEIRPGDVIHTPPGEWHWHGAAPDHFMTHLAIWDGLADGQDGPETEWAEHVTDEEYGQRPA
jgi:quercetin dioxygenase-like cupin family protein